MELVLEDFLTSYPDYVPDPDRLFAVYGDSDMYDIIQRKKEFSELKLASSEIRSQEKGSLLLHQKYIRRFLSGYTPYHAVLLWHDVGTGKTISSIAVAEGIKKDQPDFNKALVICRGPTFIRNFKDELKKISDQYIPKVREDRELSENERVRRTNKLINSYYELSTFQVFGNHIKDMIMLDKKNGTQRVRDMYSNRVIIIDEVHNLRSKKAGGGDDTYTNIHEFLHMVKNTKIVLLSATPIKDSVYEFADIMNLILPMDKQLPTRKQFVQLFFQQRVSPDPPLLINREQLLSIKGYISYLRQTRSSLRIIQAGQLVDGISIPIVVLPMTSPQLELYEDAYRIDIGRKDQDVLQQEQKVEALVELNAAEEFLDENDEDENDEDGEKVSGLYKLSRQASLFAYREGDNKKYGSAIKREQLKAISKLIILPNVDKSQNSTEAKLARLKQYSSKYHYIISTILNQPNHNFFIFSKFVTGSGIMVLTFLLKLFDFEEATGDSRNMQNETTTRKKRFAEIKGTTIEGNVERLIDHFNRPENKYGDFIQVMIGSSVIGEGRSLKSVRDIMIVSPHWNYTEIDQAIGRGIRYESHNYLPEDEQEVTIHRLAVNSTDQFNSIDLQMYRMADKKDRMIKQLEYFVRETAIDCVNNKERNTYPVELNQSRECLYQPCPYQCSIEHHEPQEEIVDSYNLFYTEKEYREIKELLQSLFLSSLQFSYRLEEFLQYPQVQRFTNIVLLRCLSTIIYRQEEFINPLGWPSYLKEKNNEYFLVYNRLSQSDPSIVYDTKLCQLYPSRSFEQYLNDYQFQHLMDILLQIKQQLELNREQYASIIFSHILLPIKLTILKEIIKVHPYSRYPNIEEIGRTNVEKFFVSKLKGYLSVVNREYTISVDEKDQVHNFIMKLKEKRQQGFLYYGYEGKKDVPNISLISNIPIAKSSGKACTSYQPDELYAMVDNLNKNAPKEKIKQSKEELCVVIKASLEREELMTTLEVSKKIKQLFNQKGEDFLDSYQSEIEEKADE